MLLIAIIVLVVSVIIWSSGKKAEGSRPYHDYHSGNHHRKRRGR